MDRAKLRLAALAVLIGVSLLQWVAAESGGGDVEVTAMIVAWIITFGLTGIRRE